MDTELASQLMKMTEGIARIDERTISIHENQVKLSKTFEDHVDDDRTDFKEVHKRITTLGTKQSWIVGVISVVGVGLTAAVTAIARNIIGG